MKSVVLSIKGIHCDNCVMQLTRTLELINGVQQVEVDLLSRSARVEHDEGVCSLNDLTAAVTRAGFQVDGFETVGSQN